MPCPHQSKRPRRSAEFVRLRNSFEGGPRDCGRNILMSTKLSEAFWSMPASRRGADLTADYNRDRRASRAQTQKTGTVLVPSDSCEAPVIGTPAGNAVWKIFTTRWRMAGVHYGRRLLHPRPVCHTGGAHRPPPATATLWLPPRKAP